MRKAAQYNSVRYNITGLNKLTSFMGANRP